MNTPKVSKKHHSSQKTTLLESESKTILAGYGIPVVAEKTVDNEAGTVAVAEKIGFPVVLKGMGEALQHKTERGIVHLDLKDKKAVEKAARLIAEETGDELEGFLVQPFLTGKREFVAGMFRDEQFGPVIMFGLGGIFTEALSDVVFRLAPLLPYDIEQMLAEFKSKRLLGAFRGEKAVDSAQIRKTLEGLSRISLEHSDIAEIDINPLLVDSDGKVCAVDALIIKESVTKKKEFLPPVSSRSIRFFFHPKSMAFIGASSTFGKWGYLLPVNTMNGRYNGKINFVNPKGGTILGREAYKSVEEVPDDIDLAVVTVPAAKVLDLIPQLQRKGVKGMLLISAGFRETGEKGAAMEARLLEEARKADILVVGPNTMGVCNPHIDLHCTSVNAAPRAGSTAMLSQSGNMGLQLLSFADQQNVGIRGFCGSGNEAMVTIEDFLDAFEVDNLTNTVMLYVESVKNGRRFFESARRVSQKKPVIMLKGGRSEAGNQAASSHTGAMTSNVKVFDAMCRQTGIIQVNQSLEMLDLAACFSSLPLPKGNRVAIVTLGGGWGVITADLCNFYGLNVPELSPGIIEKMDKILPPFWSRANPLDLVGQAASKLPYIVMEELMKWDGCDAVISLGVMGNRVQFNQLCESAAKSDPYFTPQVIAMAKKRSRKFENAYVDHVIDLVNSYEKPVFNVSIVPDEKDKIIYSKEGSLYRNVVFPTPERAVKSLARMVDYHRFVKQQTV